MVNRGVKKGKKYQIFGEMAASNGKNEKASKHPYCPAARHSRIRCQKNSGQDERDYLHLWGRGISVNEWAALQYIRFRRQQESESIVKERTNKGRSSTGQESW